MVSPNAATWIGYSLAEKGIYQGGWWSRLRGPAAKNDPGEPRMFHLPGEPLYTAAGLLILPQPLQRFMHLPVTVLLIGCAAWWALRLGGRAMGLTAGLIGMFHPFVLLHGMVWDDTFLGAALDWLGAGIVLAILMRPQKKMRWTVWTAILIVTGYAAITRAASQVVFGLIAAALLIFPSLRAARLSALAMIVGMILALSLWGFRNRATSGEFFVGSTHDGITLWESVYPSAIEALIKTGAEERMNNQRMLDDFAHTRHMGELQANAYFLHRARSYMAAHPNRMAATGFIKLADALAGWNFDASPHGTRNLVSVSANALMFLLALPALIGGKMWSRCDRSVRVWVMSVFTAQGLVTFALLFLGPSSLRYWMSLQPIFWMADAWTILSWFGLQRAAD